MNRLLIAFSIFLILSVSVMAGPKYELSETGFNFGKTIQHAKVSHTFWIKSTGDDTLRVEEIDPSCGCAQAPITDSVIAPGDSTALEIILSTKSYRGFVSKRPNFTTNVSEEKVYIRIDAELMTEPEKMMPIAFSPTVVDVSQFTKQPRRKAKFLIENRSDKDFKITIIDDKHKMFDLEMPGKVKAGETAEGLIIVHEDAIETEFQQSITFEIDDDFRSRFSIPIKRTYRILKSLGK